VGGSRNDRERGAVTGDDSADLGVFREFTNVDRVETEMMVRGADCAFQQRVKFLTAWKGLHRRSVPVALGGRFSKRG
jgi:hypothetical protein